MVVITFSIVNTLLIWLWVDKASLMPTGSYFIGLFLMLWNFIVLLIAYKRQLLERY